MRANRLRRLLPLLLLVTATARLHAQDEGDPERQTPWRLSYFPYLSGGANGATVISAKLRYWHPAAYEDRVTANAAVDAGAGITFRGSRYLGARFTAPQLIDGWRFHAVAVADRQVRFGYFGLGNETEKDDDLVTE